MENQIDKYTYRIEWSEEDEVYIARCLEFPSLAAHGDTPESALKEIKFVVDESIKWLKEDLEPVPEPFSLKKYKGNITLRVPPQTHRSLAIRAAEEGISINQYITSIIESNVDYSYFIEAINVLKQQFMNIKMQLEEVKLGNYGPGVSMAATASYQAVVERSLKKASMIDLFSQRGYEEGIVSASWVSTLAYGENE